MQDRPVIKTAIPKHRYQIGDFSASLLGEIDSGDEKTYRYILAFVQMGRAEPSFYVCAEPSPPLESAQGKYRLRVINEAMSEVVDSADKWGDLDAFAEQGVKLGVQALGLKREQVVQLM
ncbi:MAG: hypothetical protein U9Q81_22410 [Pseudomonadota bacterium]|nr:hypothetical protein [Pseudomonadota bacterium]